MSSCVNVNLSKVTGAVLYHGFGTSPSSVDMVSFLSISPLVAVATTTYLYILASYLLRIN